MFVYCGNNPICASDPTGRFFLYDLWNAAEDFIWKIGASVLRTFGYDLTGDLLDLAASGPDNTYKAAVDSPVAQEIAANEGFVNTVRETYKNEGNGSVHFESGTRSYEFPVSQGDLGAALHNVDYKYKTFTNTTTGEKCLYVTITDTFDFTECKNPFTQGSVKSSLLWLANDIAYIDTRWGLLDPVPVEIGVVISIEP